MLQLSETGENLRQRRAREVDRKMNIFAEKKEKMELRLKKGVN